LPELDTLNMAHDVLRKGTVGFCVELRKRTIFYCRIGCPFNIIAVSLRGGKIMSSFYLILALVFSLLIAIIALANQESVSINYIFGRSEVPLIILILGAGFIGAMAMGLFSLFRGIRSALSFRQLRQQKKELQKKISDLEEEKIFLTGQLNRLSSVQEEIAGDETTAVKTELTASDGPEEDLVVEAEDDGAGEIELAETDEADEKPS